MLNTECRTTTSADQSAFCPVSSKQRFAAWVGRSKLGFPFRRWPFPTLPNTPKCGSDHFRPGRHGRLRPALPPGKQKRSEDTTRAWRVGEGFRFSRITFRTLSLSFTHVYALVFVLQLFSELCRLSDTTDKNTADILNRVVLWLRLRINCKHCIIVTEAPATPPVSLSARRDARFIAAGVIHTSTEDMTSNSNMAGFSTPRTVASSAWRFNGWM